MEFEFAGGRFESGVNRHQGTATGLRTSADEFFVVNVGSS
jgi:hypothetical protein